MYEAETGKELARGEVPERAVAVGSTRVKSFEGGEFGMPCLVDVPDCTRLIQTGALVDVDADRGVVRVIVEEPPRG